MSGWEDELLDDFLRELPEPELAAVISEVVEDEVPTLDPPPGGREALLRAARYEGRYHRFAAEVARLLDVDEVAAKAKLDRIDLPEAWEGSPVPGVKLYHLEGGPEVANAITGFIRIEPGGGFPEHEHVGEEYVLVLQGSYEDSVTGEVSRPGDVCHRVPGTSHALTVRPGPGLLYLAVVQDGIRLGGQLIGPEDARM